MQENNRNKKIQEKGEMKIKKKTNVKAEKH